MLLPEAPQIVEGSAAAVEALIDAGIPLRSNSEEQLLKIGEGGQRFHGIKELHQALG
jgi:hypothetical protein